jgi:hypothetical protein
MTTATVEPKAKADKDALRPQDDPIIKRFEKEAREAGVKLKEVVDFTATKYWTDKYQARRKLYADEREANAKGLERQANKLRQIGWSAEDSKDVKDIVKGADEQRERYEAFQGFTVQLREPITTLDAIRFNYTETANRLADKEPLFQQDVGKLLLKLVGQLPAATWSDETGQVTVG